MTDVPAAEPDPYQQLVREVSGHLADGQALARASVAAQRLLTYHAIGATIVTRQAEQGWGSHVIDRLSADLRILFSDQPGLSPRNLHYMRSLALGWPDGDLAAAAAKLPWGHMMVLIDRLDDRATREWYAERALVGGWSRGVLQDRIKGQLHIRAGAAPSNFAQTLPAPDSDLAQQATRDPVLLEFLGLTEPARERDLEQAMVDNITRTMLELGDGMAFVGNQVPLQVDDTEFLVDLLFFHIPSSAMSWSS